MQFQLDLQLPPRRLICTTFWPAINVCFKYLEYGQDMEGKVSPGLSTIFTIYMYTHTHKCHDNGPMPENQIVAKKRSKAIAFYYVSRLRERKEET